MLFVRAMGVLFVLVIIFLILRMAMKLALVEGLKAVVRDFTDNYNDLSSLLEYNQSYQEILSAIPESVSHQPENVESEDEYEENYDTGLIWFGADTYEFRNTTELRKSFIISGGRIIDSEEYLEDRWNYSYKDTDEYRTFMKALVRVRIACIANGEPTVAEAYDEYNEEDNVEGDF